MIRMRLPWSIISQHPPIVKSSDSGENSTFGLQSCALSLWNAMLTWHFASLHSLI